MSSSSKLRPYLTVIIVYNLSCLQRFCAYPSPTQPIFYSKTQFYIASYVLNGTFGRSWA